jgi:hypothetical protein
VDAGKGTGVEREVGHEFSWITLTKRYRKNFAPGGSFDSRCRSLARNDNFAQDDTKA